MVITRHRFLRYLGCAVLALVFYPLRALAARFSFGESLSAEPYTISPVADMQPQATAPVDGVAPITPNSQFYVEDIHGPPKHLNAKTWRLKISGNIERPFMLSLDDIRKRPTVRQIVTLSCIGNPVGGYALGNAEWEGISLKDLLNELQPSFFAKTIVFKAADGYHESMSITEGNHPAALLAHTMNGQPLPRKHGFPLRLVIPGRYGIKQIKWLNAIEVSDQSHIGYWPKRNWSRDGKVKILSRIDFPQNDGWVLEPQTVLRGIAFAGDRGIQYVQVSTDGERTWSLAKLEKPLSPYSWVFWSFPMKFSRSGRYSVSVRAADMYSGIQRGGQRDAFPAGVDGFHRIRFNVLLG